MKGIEGKRKGGGTVEPCIGNTGDVGFVIEVPADTGA